MFVLKWRASSACSWVLCSRLMWFMCSIVVLDAASVITDSTVLFEVEVRVVDDDNLGRRRRRATPGTVRQALYWATTTDCPLGRVNHEHTSHSFRFTVSSIFYVGFLARFLRVHCSWRRTCGTTWSCYPAASSSSPHSRRCQGSEGHSSFPHSEISYVFVLPVAHS